jgi:asparagine synthase (glutamine-hydrolysing)
MVNRRGDLALTADVRLDNRGELIAALKPGDSTAHEWSDGQLILAAYEKWSENCLDRLIGDFAFAIWDVRRQELFCARDHFGVKPFYYCAFDKLFAFASEVKALLDLPEVPHRLNESRIAEHLAGVFSENESTFYKGILRLPPGRFLKVTRDHRQSFPYWSLDPSVNIRFPSDKEYAQAFREIFLEAVRCRLRSAGPIGAMLSGGLDSSSVTCVARRLLEASGCSHLRTFSTVFDVVTQCDERRYIGAVLASDRLDAHFISGDQRGPLTDLDCMHRHTDQPFFAPGLHLTWQVYAATREQGVRVLLDGHDGDTVVSHGYQYVQELAAAGRWRAVAGEIQGLARHFEISVWKLLGSYAWHYGLRPLRERINLPHLSRPRWSQLRDSGTARPPAWCSLLKPEFVERNQLRARHKAWRQTLPATARTEREGHYRALTQAIQPFALEVFDSVAAAHGIEPRYPFYDRRLVEFCLAIPPDQKLSRGWTRMILRRAMADILPTEVQWRQTKTDFLPGVAHNLRVFDRERLDRAIFRSGEAIADYVDRPALMKAYQRFTTRAHAETFADVMDIWKVTSLALWLEQAAPSC